MTGQAGELIYRGGVAVPASGIMMIQKVLTERDRVWSGKCPRRPVGGRVTLGAIRAKCASVERWLTMTGSTIPCEFELPRHMALHAIQQGMSAGQRECRGIVIEGNILPAGRHVAEGTVLPQLTVMLVVPGMAGKTIFRGASENIIAMAGHTVDVRMLAEKRKCCFVMIEFSPCPCRRLVTGGAVPAKLTAMHVVSGVTGKAVAGRIFVYPVDMAGVTRHIHV